VLVASTVRIQNAVNLPVFGRAQVRWKKGPACHEWLPVVGHLFSSAQRRRRTGWRHSAK
jgi:hypothetical protein